jgi:hypothetical protein
VAEVEAGSAGIDVGKPLILIIKFALNVFLINGLTKNKDFVNIITGDLVPSRNYTSGNTMAISSIKIKEGIATLT